MSSDLFNDYFELTDTKLAGVKCGEEALVYLFCIAAGLESMVLGEGSDTRSVKGCGRPFKNDLDTAGRSLII
ncbi:MAG: hypothetical protein ACLR7D_07150 [Lachnospira eligens]